jgi:GNAT superfamily N-acetyltransferase
MAEAEIDGTFETRPVGPTDLESVLEHIQAGFDFYAEFAPDGWEPPQVFEDRDRTAALLADPETWTLLAVGDARSLGHIAFFPARLSTINDSPSARRFAPRPPGLAHLWHLFVRPDWWGKGVASVLHESAVSEMSKRGFSSARLVTPALHVRARRFYERRGWCVTGEMFNEGLELMLTEYRLALRPEDIRPTG